MSTCRPRPHTSSPLCCYLTPARPPQLGPALAGPAHSTPGPCQQGSLAPSPFGVTVWPGLLALSVPLGHTLSNGSGSPLPRPPVPSMSPKVKASGPTGPGLSLPPPLLPLPNLSPADVVCAHYSFCSLSAGTLLEQRLAHTFVINIFWAAAVECWGPGVHSAHKQLLKADRPSRHRTAGRAGLRPRVPGEASGCRVGGSGLTGLKSSCGGGIWRPHRHWSGGSCAGSCGLGPRERTGRKSPCHSPSSEASAVRLTQQ